MEPHRMKMTEPYPNCVKINHNSFWYIVTDAEFAAHWLPNVPTVIKMAGLKRGKYYSRWLKDMNTKGSGKHAKD